MSTQPKPSEAQDLASDFFSGSGAVHVEARSAAGEVVSVEWRCVSQRHRCTCKQF